MEVMLDLETMGNTSNAAIIAIGAVAFDDSVVVDSFYVQVNLESSMANGGFIDGGTVMWWLKQSDSARGSFADNDKAQTIQQALSEFQAWCKSVKASQVWGNGAMFDNVIISNAYKRCGMEIPWKFWNDMCYRTVKNMNKSIPLERVGVHHNAVDDAKSQALHLLKIRASK